jgi:DMSO/TMAO reductase YedYZ heme-binding membrane subunit
VIHILTTVLDSYVATGFISAIVPMTSAYKRVAIAFGTVAFDLILAVWISSLLKLRIANTTWRFIHWFSWIGFCTALVHAYMSGTDSRTGVGLVVVSACAGAVVLAALWRFFGRPTRAAGRTALSPLARLRGPVEKRPLNQPFASSPRAGTKRGGQP